MRTRVSRLVVGLMSLALVLSVQFMVMAGVASEQGTVSGQLMEVSQELSPAEMTLKVIMVLLLISGLALVTLGVESLIDRLPYRRTAADDRSDSTSGKYAVYQAYQPKEVVNKPRRQVKPVVAN